MSETSIVPGGFPVPPTRVATDQKTILGSGTAEDPLVAQAGELAVVVGDATLDGDGTTVRPLSVHKPALDHAIRVSVDGSSIVGDGTASSPLAAVGGPSGAGNSDGVTLQGTGIVAAPFALKAIQHDATLAGLGTVASPIAIAPVVVGPALAGLVPVDVDGATIAGDGAATPLRVVPAALAGAVAVAVSGAITGAGTTGSPLAVNPAALSHAVAVLTDGVTMSGDGTTGNPLVSIAAGGGLYINVKSAPYNAKGDGVTDDSAAIQAAANAAQAASVALYFPAGTYLVSNQSGASTTGYCIHFTAPNLHIIGHINATIKWASSVVGGITTHAFKFETTCDHVLVEGMTFQGDNTASLTNGGGGCYFLGDITDVTVRDCKFIGLGPPALFTSDGTAPGRFIFTNNRTSNCCGSVATPYRSLIVNNIFDEDAYVNNRSHMIYLYGAADGCAIVGNVFRRSDSRAGTYAIQIRADDGRYDHKHGFSIAGNIFYECMEGIFAGSDEQLIVDNFSITGNIFYNCKVCVSAFGLRDSVIADNSCIATWEMGSTGSVAIYAAHGGVSAAGHLANSEIAIRGNTLVNMQPYFGLIDITALPVAGDTVTVGTTTYTWRAAAAVAGDVTIGATAIVATDNLTTALRGLDGINSINKVLRNGQDALHSLYSYDGSSQTRVIVASYATFVIASTGAALTITPVVANTPWACGIKAEAALWPQISGNTVKDVAPGIQVERCMQAVVEDNRLIGSAIVRLSSVFSKYKNNHFVIDPLREKTANRDDRWMPCTDGFYVASGNGQADLVAQQLESITGNGYSGVVSVGDGRARCRLFYGTETLGGVTNAANSFPWRWSDGDVVQITGGPSGTVSWTFHRTAPGAGQFNTADTLLALINASADFTAAYLDFTNTGGDADPKLMIEITCRTVGVAGNACVLSVISAAVDGVDLRSIRMCGVLLLDHSTAKTNSCTFLGGAATATKTVIWSPDIGKIHGARVQGIDATSHALAPVIYQADITPGVAGVITHGVAAGTEKFIYIVA